LTVRIPLFSRIQSFLLVVLVLMAASVIAFLAHGAAGGSLDPPGAPASTMHTLGDTPPVWDQVLNAANGAPGPTNPPAGCNSDRFKCVMNYQQCGGVCINVFPAVLDEETGLVWERTADATSSNWIGAEHACATSTTGQRQGWRLPTLAELASLAGGAGSLPAGHPFSSPINSSYWSSTIDPATPTSAYGLEFRATDTILINANQSAIALGTWCVRGATSNR
jgi:hypothetical protein